jgi:hypothetical protein
LKAVKAKQAYEKSKAEVMQMQNALDEMVQKRELMQKKLHELYVEQQKKKQAERYRNNSTFGSESSRSMQSTESNSTFFDNNAGGFLSSFQASSSANSSGFFDKPSRRNSRDSQIFPSSVASNTNSPKSQSKKKNSSQANRPAFFA